MILRDETVGGVTLRKPGFIHAHRIIWRQGGPWGRFFLLVGVFTYLFLPALLIWMFWRFLEHSLSAEAVMSVGLAATTYGAFHETFSNGMISARVWRQYIEEGVIRSHGDYFREYARFLEAQNRWGLLPGAIAWSIFFWALYYSLIISAIPFALFYAPTLTLATPLIFAIVISPIVFLCWLGWKLHLRGVGRLAREGGYRLSELAPSGSRGLSL